MTGPLFLAPAAAPDWWAVQAEGRDEWADKYGLWQVEPRHRCLVWLTGGRHNRNGCTQGTSGWADHPSAWRVPGGGRVLLLQPYNFERHYLKLSKALSTYPQVYPVFERPENGWHHPSTTAVELWCDEETYNNARKGAQQ